MRQNGTVVLIMDFSFSSGGGALDGYQKNKGGMDWEKENESKVETSQCAHLRAIYKID